MSEVRETAVAREARVAGLRDFETPTLEAVERRRWQLLGLAAFAMVGLAGGMVLLSVGALQTFTSLPLYAIRILFLGFAAVFGFYLLDKESRLRNVTRLLVNERVLSAALSNRLKELSILSEVGKALNQVLDVGDVLRMILRSSLDLLEVEEGSIMLADETGENLVVACAETRGERAIEGATVKVGQGVAGWVARKREPVLISGRAPSDFFEISEPSDRPIVSSISVPLVSEDQLWGVLNVNDMSGEREFTEYDLRAVSLFAEHAAIAIRNARLFEQEHKLIEQMAEVDRLKSDFIATMSHELRTPLTTIIGCAKTVRRRHDALDEGQRSEFLQMIERQGERLLRMIEDVLSAARIESGHAALKRERVDLVEMARAVAGGIEAAGGRSPIKIDAPERVSAYCDPTAIEQVLANLVENASKYSEAGAPVEVRIFDRPQETRVEVADRGRGIPAEMLPTVFDRFRQVEPSPAGAAGGVGLGLYIVKNLVEAMGGTVSVESEEGRGSTFAVVLPKRREGGDDG